MDYVYTQRTEEGQCKFTAFLGVFSPDACKEVFWFTTSWLWIVSEIVPSLKIAVDQNFVFITKWQKYEKNSNNEVDREVKSSRKPNDSK